MSAGNGAAPQSEALRATRISPSMTVNDLSASVRFYTEGLGFEIDRENSDDSGTMRFAMLRSGTAYLGIGQDDFAKGRDRVKGVGIRVWLTTDQNVEAIARRAQSAGIELDFGPAPLPWGPMAFGVTDPDGFLLTIVQDG